MPLFPMAEGSEYLHHVFFDVILWRDIAGEYARHRTSERG